MVSRQRPGNGAPSQRPQDQGERRHQRCVRGHAGGQGEVPDLGGGEERGPGLEGGGHFRPAAAAAARWRRHGAIHAACPRPAPGPGGSGQAAGTGRHQPAAAQRGQDPQQDRVSAHRRESERGQGCDPFVFIMFSSSVSQLID